MKFRINLKEAKIKFDYPCAQMIPLEKLAPEYISSQLKKIPAQPIIMDTISAGVLVPFLFENNTWKILFTQRTNQVKNHKGQVSFPGGASEPQDRSIVDTALREAFEEIGLERDNFQIYGSMQRLESVSGYCVYPIVGRIRKPYSYTLERREVESIFTVPVRFLFDAKNWQEQDYHYKNRQYDKVIVYKDYKQYKIWGVTARIVIDLYQLLK